MSDLSGKVSDTLPAISVIYPPADLPLPVESPVQVWVFFGYSDGTSGGVQPVSFFKTTGNDYTTVVSSDSFTDADGYARAIVRLSKPGTLGKKETFEGSVTARIMSLSAFDPNGTAIAALHADTSAGGPDKVEWENKPAAYPPVIDHLIILPTYNIFRLKHTLADGRDSTCVDLTCSPSDPTKDAFFVNDIALGDAFGTAWNPAAVQRWVYGQPRPPGWVFDSGLTARAPNVIVQQDNVTAWPPGVVSSLGGLVSPPNNNLKIGPAEDMTKRSLPSGTSVLFKAILTDELGSPIQGKHIDVWGRCDGEYTIVQPATNTDAYGETSFSVTVPDNGRAMAVLASYTPENPGGGVVHGYTQGNWCGLFYDPNNPPFVNESVRITPPGTRQTIGVGAEYKVTVLQGYDPTTGKPYLPVANQTVYWEASPRDRIIFSPLTGPLNTVPGTRFPTVTDSQGKSAIRVSAIGSTAFFGTIIARVANPETGTFFRNEVAVGFQPPS
ncbi:hypothetical protein [Brucella sp. IR073]|uniref:hypothetical protein n=1 Tax=unclassified Brucella TaxID=2632610 RepID=UPI003B986334